MTAIEFNYRITGLQDHLKNFANKLTSNNYESDDLVQETLLKALRFRDKFVDSTNLKAWLFTIMKNTYINDYRKKKRANTILENSAPYAYLNVRSSYHEGCAERPDKIPFHNLALIGECTGRPCDAPRLHVKQTHIG